MVASQSGTSPEGEKEMSDFTLELINFMGRVMGRGPSNKVADLLLCAASQRCPFR